jgi:hypothetical protein
MVADVLAQGEGFERDGYVGEKRKEAARERMIMWRFHGGFFTEKKSTPKEA